MLPIWRGWSVRDAGCLFESPDSSPLRLCSFCLASRWSGCGVVCIEPLGRSASVIWRLAALMSPIWRGFTLSAALMRSVGRSLFICVLGGAHCIRLYSPQAAAAVAGAASIWPLAFVVFTATFGHTPPAMYSLSPFQYGFHTDGSVPFWVLPRRLCLGFTAPVGACTAFD